jgi:hypothetical protein
MGVCCGFYRMSNEMVDNLKSQPEHAQNYIDENYCWISGKYHIEDDIVFETDKAWDIVKFLLQKCDPSPGKVLQELYGKKIDPAGDWDYSRYINAEKVRQILRVIQIISPEQIIKAYNHDEMIKDGVYRARLYDEPDWDYFFFHIETMKRAFAKAVASGDNIVVHFH